MKKFKMLSIVAQTKCPKCGKKLSAGAKRCPSCGHILGTY